MAEGCFADFAIGGSPNGVQSKGSPRWSKYVDGGVTKPGLQLRVKAFGNGRVEGDGIRMVQCE